MLGLVYYFLLYFYGIFSARRATNCAHNRKFGAATARLRKHRAPPLPQSSTASMMFIQPIYIFCCFRFHQATHRSFAANGRPLSWVSCWLASTSCAISLSIYVSVYYNNNLFNYRMKGTMRMHRAPVPPELGDAEQFLWTGGRFNKKNRTVSFVGTVGPAEASLVRDDMLTREGTRWVLGALLPLIFHSISSTCHEASDTSVFYYDACK